MGGLSCGQRPPNLEYPLSLFLAEFLKKLPRDKKMKNMVARYDRIKFSKKLFGNIIYKIIMFNTYYHFMLNVDYLSLY